MKRRKAIKLISSSCLLIGACKNPFKPESKVPEKRFRTVEEALEFLNSIGCDINWNARPTNAEIIAFANYLAGYTDSIGEGLIKYFQDKRR